MMLDRKIAPPLHSNRKINLPGLETFSLENGIPVHVVRMGKQPLLELAAVFPAGKSFESNPGLSGITSRLFPEGTRFSSGLEFAQKLDRLGAHLDVDAGYESSTVALTTLSRCMKDSIPLMQEMIVSPLFAREDFRRLTERTLRHLEVEEKKTDYVARMEFPRLLFGDKHPYGSPVGRSEIASLPFESVAPFHEHYYALRNCYFVAVGNFEIQELLESLNKSFGQCELGPVSMKVNPADSAAAQTPSPPAKGFHFFEKPESQQATVRIGHTGFQRNHPDFHPMEVTNMVFGGYFSSRLNKVIREEKGYTYGIHSNWVGLRYGGYLVIHSDVGNEFAEPTLRQVRIEMQRLQDKGVTDEELLLVKNYMQSRLVSSRETPGQLAETLVALLVNGLTWEDLGKKFDRIEAVTKDDVLEMAQKWFRPDDLLEVVAGKKMNPE